MILASASSTSWRAASLVASYASDAHQKVYRLYNVHTEHVSINLYKLPYPSNDQMQGMDSRLILGVAQHKLGAYDCQRHFVEHVDGHKCLLVDVQACNDQH